MRIHFQPSKGENRNSGSAASQDLQPSRLEIFALACVFIIACILAAHIGGGYWKLVRGFGDNANYAAISKAIRTWDLGSLPTAKRFWGVSYAASAVAAVARTTELQAVIIVSIGSTLGALLLAYELWGGWVTLYFLVIDWSWIQSTGFGGALPLFVAMLFAALLAAKHERWVASAAFGALATTVQPLGVFLLAPILLMEWRRRGGWVPGPGVVPAVGILTLYLVPFVIRFHNVFASYDGYQRQDWRGGLPITYPLGAIIENFRNGLNFGSPVAKYIKVAYVVFQVLALGLLGFISSFRRRALERPLELMLVVSYSAFILLYNSPYWALVIHARLLVPLLPFFLWVFYDRLPKRRWLAYSLGVVSLMLACAGALRIYEVHELASHLLAHL